jgi:hypothetical protein
MGSWIIYREGLKPAYRQHFDNIMLYARIQSDVGSLSARMFISESLFLSALIEQQKNLEKLEKDLKKNIVIGYLEEDEDESGTDSLDVNKLLKRK